MPVPNRHRGNPFSVLGFPPECCWQNRFPTGILQTGFRFSVLPHQFSGPNRCPTGILGTGLGQRFLWGKPITENRFPESRVGTGLAKYLAITGSQTASCEPVFSFRCFLERLWQNRFPTGILGTCFRCSVFRCEIFGENRFPTGIVGTGFGQRFLRGKPITENRFQNPS